MHTMENSQKQISLLCYNTYGIPFIAPSLNKRYTKFAQLIQESTLDVLLLQEVSSYYHLALLKKHLTAYPYVSYKHYFYGPKGGLVIFSKLPLEKSTYTSFVHQGSFTNISFYTKIFQNGVLTCQLKDTSIVLANTHLITDFEFHWSKRNKMYLFVRNQMRETAALVNKLSKKKQDVIIAGDFNMAKDGNLYADFLHETQAIDLFDSFTFPTYYNNRISEHFRASISARIDYIFLKKTSHTIKSLSVSHFLNKTYPIGNGEKSYLSDHIGLYCILKFNE